MTLDMSKLNAAAKEWCPPSSDAVPKLKATAPTFTPRVTATAFAPKVRAFRWSHAYTQARTHLPTHIYQHYPQPQPGYVFNAPYQYGQQQPQLLPNGVPSTLHATTIHPVCFFFFTRLNYCDNIKPTSVLLGYPPCRDPRDETTIHASWSCVD